MLMMLQQFVRFLLMFDTLLWTDQIQLMREVCDRCQFGHSPYGEVELHFLSHHFEAWV